jgi:hypothetical protein
MKAIIWLTLALSLLVSTGCPDKGPTAPKSPGGTTTGGGW